MTTATHQLPDRSTLSQRWFARLWSWLDDPIDDTVAAAKDRAFVDLADRVVEIGPGRGSNFKRFSPGTVVVGFEPNRRMHHDLAATAAEHGIELDLRSSGVEHMDLPDASQDTVISSFTLCSVDDIDTALTEILRVLKPGGRFLFVEHIGADEGTVMARAQTVLRRPWAMIADHCDLTAQTHVALGRAGFSHVDSEVDGFGPRLDPSRRTLYGIATK